MKGLAINQRKHKEMIMKILTISGVVTFNQLLSFTKLSPSVLNTLITQLQREGRLIRIFGWIALNAEAMENKREGVVEAMWVFDDFLPRADSFVSGEFPAIICFFADGLDYEIIYVTVGQEYMISKTIPNSVSHPNRIVVIESTDQIPKISIPNTTVYCISDTNGKTIYYKRKDG